MMNDGNKEYCYSLDRTCNMWYDINATGVSCQFYMWGSNGR